MATARDWGHQQGLLATVPRPGPRPGHGSPRLLHRGWKPARGKATGHRWREGLGGQPGHGRRWLGKGPYGRRRRG
eukprot:12968363-Alexandrium_andersonii.AAC.1